LPGAQSTVELDDELPDIVEASGPFEAFHVIIVVDTFPWFLECMRFMFTEYLELRSSTSGHDDLSYELGASVHLLSVPESRALVVI
jgi:hypothetical protein